MTENWYFDNIYRMKFSKAPESAFFTSWYFLANAGLILLYPILRMFTSVGLRDLRHLDSFGFTYENSIIYTGLAFIGMYYLRSSSLREFLLDCLAIGKIVVSCLLFFAKFRFCIYYVLLCFVSWLLIPYPRCNAPNKFIKIESEEQFDDLVGPEPDEDETEA